MTDDTPETTLTKVVAILEENIKILQHHRLEFKQLFKETAEIKQRLDKLESSDSLDSTDTESLKSMTVRLKDISTIIDEKKL
jgi:uncharacterized protein YdcH (DUF465 family)